MSAFLDRLWLAFNAFLFTMLALRTLGVTDGFDPLAALVTVVAVGTIAEYVQEVLR